MTSPQISSPDITPYVDLTLYDADAQQLLAAAVTLAATRMPTWTPQVGNVEVVLLEVLCTTISELILRTNRIPAAVVEAVLGLFDVVRGAGLPATAVAQFQMIDTQPRVLPAGTRLAITLAGTAFTFSTAEDLTIEAGSDSGQVLVASDDLTDQLNGTPAGTVVQLIDSVSWVERVTLVTAVANGSGPETSEQLLDRGRQTFKTLSSVLVTPGQFRAAALATPGVWRAVAVRNYDPASGLSPGLDPGNIAIAVLGSGGSTLASTAKDALQQALLARSSGDLSIHIIDPTLTPVDVAVAVSPVPGADRVALRQSIVDTIAGYLSPATWEWGGIVRINELIVLVDGVDGVDYVVDVSVPTRDVTLAGAAPLPTAGTITVTVQ